MIRNLLLGALLFVTTEVFAQKVAIKSNLLYDVTSTLNLGVETALAPRWTLDFSANYNPWNFSGNKKIKHFLFQPEARWWPRKSFNGHFVGVYGQYGQYNAGGMFGLKYRYEGWMAGGGLSYGYHWMLGNRWGIEATVGVGYAMFRYDKYDCPQCGSKVAGDVSKGFFGPTKAGVTLIFMIK